eukprot:6733044-Prymnesium_polylepis.1
MEEQQLIEAMVTFKNTHPSATVKELHTLLKQKRQWANVSKSRVDKACSAARERIARPKRIAESKQNELHLACGGYEVLLGGEEKCRWAEPAARACPDRGLEAHRAGRKPQGARCAKGDDGLWLQLHEPAATTCALRKPAHERGRRQFRGQTLPRGGGNPLKHRLRKPVQQYWL